MILQVMNLFLNTIEYSMIASCSLYNYFTIDIESVTTGDE